MPKLTDTQTVILSRAATSAWRALGKPELKKWYAWVKTQGVYFSLSLDLDMMMLKAFPEPYQSISSIKDTSKLNAEDYVESVFGKAGNGLTDYTTNAPTAAELAIYDDLFKKGSKPISHIEAMTLLTDEELKAQCPKPLERLFKDCATRLGIDLSLEASG
jgi:putative ATP-dependent endonuclease of OLD family